MADKFSPSLLKFLKETFDGFDKDGDGKLTREDIRNMMRFSGQNPTEEQVQFHFNEFDLDDSDTVDFHEYVTVLMKRLVKGGEHDCVLKSFQCLDKDGDGFLSRDDLRQTFEEKKIDEMMKYARDGNEKLDCEEFAKWVKDNKILGELFSIGRTRK